MVATTFAADTPLAVAGMVIHSTLRLNTDKPDEFALSMLLSLTVTSVIWLSATFLTQPESPQVL